MGIDELQKVANENFGRIVAATRTDGTVKLMRIEIIGDGYICCFSVDEAGKHGGLMFKTMLNNYTTIEPFDKSRINP